MSGDFDRESLRVVIRNFFSYEVKYDKEALCEAETRNLTFPRGVYIFWTIDLET